MAEEQNEREDGTTQEQISELPADEPSPGGPGETPAAVETPAAEAAAVEEMTTEEEVEALRQQLEEEQRKRAEYHDSWLRSVAELRNYKKRVGQEHELRVREANATLISHLLPVLDDFERAMAILPDQELRHFTWVEGIALIYRRIWAVLEQHGLREIEALGRPFDPYVHEAVLFEEAPAEKDQLVLAELQRGYKFQDRVLRPTLVKVGKSVATAVEESAPAEAAEDEQAVTEEAPPPAEEGQEQAPASIEDE
jgi:molecular chaperone GrpE